MVEKTYHHGDLRQALLEAAEEELQADPNCALSIRGLAGKIGVSATAPHAHFKTKTDLLAAVAADGFSKLQQSLYAGEDAAPSDLTILAERYLQFCVENVGLYRLMFNTGVQLESDAKLYTASRAAYDVLRAAIRMTYVEDSADQSDKRTLAAWALVHGLGSLLADDRLADDVIEDRSPQALARLTVAIVTKADTE
ncbi:TetR/AcrR family transcriptional regulator [Alterisphingorhabdus coralli]|uniref:TetR-like C-terminal domain-containing protein n=1 Tax=Alterisphingorhabdus coralli TaxID=3071408 RepID=A0AA97I2X2_9SPHN|nr:TetR-like C-terminal domain-containing protein [Parasphingorhabdus sp. SCSIO 66989]WOE76160.1 TetR-like C-terminal domain-containing protein [Parasphingorhabdus sp. SCSIO 66989]